MIRRIVARVLPISVSTGVPAIGKKRIRCSGGGSGVTSTIRWSSVWLVRSLLAYQPSRLVLACVLYPIEVPSWPAAASEKKNRRSSGGFWSLGASSVYALASPAAERCENQKYAKKRTGEGMARNVARAVHALAARRRGCNALRRRRRIEVAE
jgi:hypothetical protein